MPKFTIEEHEAGFSLLEDGKRVAFLSECDEGEAKRISDQLNEDLAPSHCPITRRPFFMVIYTPEGVAVPTYGGPFDSYTIPEMGGKPADAWHERELACDRYDHDAGGWVGSEGIPIRVISEDVLIELEEKAGELDAIKQQRDELLAALIHFKIQAGVAFGYWDSDQDSKVGKRLLAMSGKLPGYHHDIDAAHAAIAKVEGGAQ